MKYLIVFLFSLLISVNCFGENTLVKLKDGPNYIDLNHDGIMDIIFVASFDNNTSHPNHTATIFIKNDQGWSIIPIPEDSGFSWSDFSLSASIIKIVDFELHKYKNTYFMVKGTKFSGKLNDADLTDDTLVMFSRYKITSNKVDPGVPEFYWQPAGNYLTSKKYIHVNDAFQSLDMSNFK